MSRGGSRPGAGRRLGTLGKKTIARRQLASVAAEDGITPLELMLKRMRYYNQLVDRELEKGGKADLDKIDKAFRSASEAAQDAAPYVHPRLSAVEHEHGGQVGVLHELFKIIDGTGRGLPDPTKVQLPDEAPSTVPAMIELKAEPPKTETPPLSAPESGPQQQTLVMPARQRSLLPDPDAAPLSGNSAI